MSFLAYLLRQYSQQLQDFLPTLPEIVVRLLKDCPREKSSTRKELLVAIRHIINFNFRKIFLSKIDELLDEKTLIGDGLTNDRNAAWAIAPRRVLADEGQNAQQMTSIFHFLVRHPELFYDSRDKYAMLIITSLRKVAAPATASNESKKLALNMMWLIWLWEQRRVEGKGDALARSQSQSPNSK
ncbi:hypothetical protein BN1708_018137, partial [Verticillium longisporum]